MEQKMNVFVKPSADPNLFETMLRREANVENDE